MIQRHLLATILLSVILQANAFSYKDAENWGKKYSQCNGKHQSPVNLDTSKAVFPIIEEVFTVTNFRESPTKMTIKNTGHTVEVKADWSGKPPKITGGPLNGTYVFEKATFHWAQKAYVIDETLREDHNNNNNFSSNRTYKKRIVGPVPHNPTFGSQKPYTGDMEMHMFFYKTDLKSFKKAETQKSGLAVLSTLLKIEDAPLKNIFDNMEKDLHKVQSPNSTAKIDPIRLTSHQGDFVGPFVFYEGSLDYPPCSETVTWFIDLSYTPITKNLVNEFRKIKLAEGDVSNLRPTQPLNKREPKIIVSVTPYEENEKYPVKILK